MKMGKLGPLLAISIGTTVGLLIWAALFIYVPAFAALDTIGPCPAGSAIVICLSINPLIPLAFIFGFSGVFFYAFKPTRGYGGK